MDPWSSGMRFTFSFPSGSAQSGQYNLVANWNDQKFPQFAGQTAGQMSMYQPISIPEGVTFQVTAWFKSYRTDVPDPQDDSRSFTMGQVVFGGDSPSLASVVPTNMEWTKLDSGPVVNRASAGQEQYVSLVCNCGACGNGDICGIDSIEVVALSGPGGQPLCT